MSKSSRPSASPTDAAGHRIGQHRREQMQRGVHAHAGIAKVPVDDRVHRLADLEAAGRARRPADARSRSFAGVGEARALDQDGVAGRGREHAAVGGLAAGGGVEHGAVEHDAARLGEADDGGAAFLEVGVFAKQAVGGHGQSKWFMIDQTFSYGTVHVRPALEPVRHRQPLRAQELRIEQLRLIARAIVGENGDDGVARPQVLGKPDRARDVDAGRAAHAQAFVLEQIEDDRHRLLVRNQVGLVDLDVLDQRRDAPEPDAFGDRAALRRLGLAVRKQIVHGRALRVGDADDDVRASFRADSWRCRQWCRRCRWSR